MERKKPQMDQQKWKALQNYAVNGKGLLHALAGYSYYRYGGNWYTELWNALTKLYSNSQFFSTFLFLTGAAHPKPKKFPQPIQP